MDNIILMLVAIILILLFTSDVKYSFVCLILTIILSYMSEYKTSIKICGGNETGIYHPKNMIGDYTGLEPMVARRIKYIPHVVVTKENMYDCMYDHIYPDVKTKWSGAPFFARFGRNMLKDIANLPESSIIVDYGCGDGSSLEYFKSLNKKYKLYCVDVDDFRTKKDADTKFIKNISTDTFNDKIKDGSVSLIVASVSLHHVDFGDGKPFNETIENIISTMVRKLAPGGFLLIREHDVKTNKHLNSVLFEHLIYSVMEIDNKYMTRAEFVDWVKKYHLNHKGCYFSRDYIHNLIGNQGMIHKETNAPPKHWSHIYNSLFMKPV